MAYLTRAQKVGMNQANPRPRNGISVCNLTSSTPVQIAHHRTHQISLLQHRNSTHITPSSASSSWQRLNLSRWRIPPEPAHKEPEERQTRYSQEETDRLEGELSSIDALATFIPPGAVIPLYPPWRHTVNSNHLHGGASPAYEAWKFGPLELGIHIPSFHALLEAKDMSVEKISLCLGEHVGVIPSPPEFRDEDGDGVG
ncbi:hypothetical protein FOYG_00732 [Fusarium oxysporum NRRL 32931]|uniref:Uncharacterized protein n=1 Tax=Fusarium oxysporum NRRL 32931 TaxID=660029 RepID=W9J622_FUSOX|nr:hypothetical protein FOYG_00732 [Fusarium oxysporum NRRL 32931]